MDRNQINITLDLNAFSWKTPKRVTLSNSDESEVYALGREDRLFPKGPEDHAKYDVYGAFMRLNYLPRPSESEIKTFLLEYGPLTEDSYRSDKEGPLIQRFSELIKLQRILHDPDPKVLIEYPPKLEGVYGNVRACKPKELKDYLICVAWLHHHEPHMFCAYGRCKRLVGIYAGKHKREEFCDEHKKNSLGKNQRAREKKNYYKEIYKDKYKEAMKADEAKFKSLYKKSWQTKWGEWVRDEIRLRRESPVQPASSEDFDDLSELD